MCDDQGRPVRLHLTAGQVSDFKGADVLLADLPDKTEEIIGDRGYDSNRILNISTGSDGGRQPLLPSE
ncbi:transposase [Acetobacter thailandicus]|uniref:transposase n=1 Tax=Acetobacter thailandicus TaxID=1502842 RepID=UPI001BABF75C|nr:transposase [Acetobacter thailandicus]